MLVGGAIVAVVVIVVVVALIGENDSAEGADPATGPADNSATSESAFVPDLFNTEFDSGWRDKETGKPVIPPQHIRLTGSLDLTEYAESIGFGAEERALSKKRDYAATDSSFPMKNNSVNMFTNDDGLLYLTWKCEVLYNDPVSENCQRFHYLAFDVSGSEPVVVAAANGYSKDPSVLHGSKSTLNSLITVSNPSELPASMQGTDRGTGADVVLMLGAAQPDPDSAKVYFVVGDSLTLYSGELEKSR
ncbi:hypothetical protein IM25_23980 (plasmid) [Rhodococcus sp. p52]|nr:hypothetical protein IM25_23980 [Rhodococcus sp. p52]